MPVMKTRVLSLLDRLRSSYWFVPSLMAATAVAAALGTIRLDQVMEAPWVTNIGFVYTGGAEGARSLLSTVASSMITVAGVVFSITIVALSLAATQFGPRLLRNFMRDRSAQVVLGTFIATFIYCVLVLRTVRGEDGGRGFLPHISVTIAVALSLASLGVLIYFIHHVASLINVAQVAHGVRCDLDQAIDRLFPDRLGHGSADEPEEAEPPEPPPGSRMVNARESGYVQVIDSEEVLRLARERGVVVQILHRPGHFVIAGRPLFALWPGPPVDEALEGALCDATVVGIQRTLTQDMEFAIDQLVEVAVRALSPGLNDPFTAITCIDHLGAALCRLAGRRLPSARRCGEDGALRVVAQPLTFDGALRASFSQIRQYGRGSVAVMLRLLETLARVAGCARRPADRAALLRQVHAVAREAAAEVTAADRGDVAARCAAALRALGAAPE